MKKLLNLLTGKSSREKRLESLLRECLPYLWRDELGTRTSVHTRLLIDDIEKETLTN